MTVTVGDTVISTPGSAVGLADYYSQEAPQLSGSAEGIAAYHDGQAGDKTTGPREFGAGDMVFGPNQIIGLGAVDMGIGLGIEMPAWSNMVEGRHALTGDTLVAAVRKPVPLVAANGLAVLDANGRPDYERNNDGEVVKKLTHVAGIPLEASAPKSVAAAMVIGNRETRRIIQTAQDRAFRAAFARIEATVPMGRRTVKTPVEAGRLATKGRRKGLPLLTQGSSTERVPVHLVGIAALQQAARPTPETAAQLAPPNPHLHTQAFLLNLGYDPETKAWHAIDGHALMVAAKKFDAYYRSELARELENGGIPLKYATELDKHGRMNWEVAGINPKVCELWSSGSRRRIEVTEAFEKENGRPCTPRMLQRLLQASRLPKDDLAKQMDTDPDYQLWRDHAEDQGLEIASGQLIKRLDNAHPIERASEPERKAEFYQRLLSGQGLTAAGANFDAKTISDTVPRCAEGLGFSLDDLDLLELEVYGRLVVVRDAVDPRNKLYTTTVNLEAEVFIEATLAAKAATKYRSPNEYEIAAAIAAQPITLDDEQKGLVRDACSPSGLAIGIGVAGSGKTTTAKTIVSGLRGPDYVSRRDRAKSRRIRHGGAHTPAESTKAPYVTQVVVVAVSARTAQETGHKLDADFSGSIEALAFAVKTGRLRIDGDTLIVVDEYPMVDNNRAVTLLEAAGPARMLLLGDPEQIQPIGAGGWAQDAIDTHGGSVLTAVRRQTDHRHITTNAKLRAGNAVDVVADLAAQDRLHVDTTEQESWARLTSDYQRFRDRGLGAGEVRIVVDSSNADVDVANRQIQRIRRDRGEIPEQGFRVESATTSRYWTIHHNDLVIFLTPYGKGRDRVNNGSTGVVRSLNHRGVAVVELDQPDRAGNARLVKVNLKTKADEQPLGLAHALHAAKFQGGELPVVLAMPSPTTSDKFSAYSTVTRAISEAHVYVSNEQFGDDPHDALATVWARAPREHSALSVMRSGDDNRRDRSHPIDPIDKSVPQVRGEQITDREMTRLTRLIGPDPVDAIQTSDIYGTIQGRFDDLHRSGADVKAMVEAIADEGHLQNSRDPAALLVHRLDDPAMRVDRRRNRDGVALNAPRTSLQPSVPLPSRQRSGEELLNRALRPDTATVVRSSPAWPTLDRRLVDLDRSGADAPAMLRKVADGRDLASSRDAAAVLSYRLGRTERIEAVRQQGLLEPAEQGARSGRPDPMQRAREVSGRRDIDPVELARQINQQRSRDRSDDQGLGLDRGL